MKQNWTTKDGKKLRISDMESSHIANCINMLKRNNYTKIKHRILRKRWKTLLFYLTCTPPTAEMAEMAFEQEFDYWNQNWNVLTEYNPDYINRKLPELVALEKELEKRKCTTVTH